MFCPTCVGRPLFRYYYIVLIWLCWSVACLCQELELSTACQSGFDDLQDNNYFSSIEANFRQNNALCVEEGVAEGRDDVCLSLISRYGTTCESMRAQVCYQIYGVEFIYEEEEHSVTTATCVPLRCVADDIRSIATYEFENMGCPTNANCTVTYECYPVNNLYGMFVMVSVVGCVAFAVVLSRAACRRGRLARSNGPYGRREVATESHFDMSYLPGSGGRFGTSHRSSRALRSHLRTSRRASDPTSRDALVGQSIELPQIFRGASNRTRSGNGARGVQINNQLLRSSLIDTLPLVKYVAAGGGGGSGGTSQDVMSTKTETVSSGPSEGGEAGNEREDHHTCCICLDSYTEVVGIRELPCSHWFHQTCVDEWLGSHTECPLCKQPIPALEMLMDGSL